MEKFGLKAEEWMVELLSRNGTETRRATLKEDTVFKVDFWVRLNGYWLPIQFSVDKEAIMSWKGKDALQRGVVPIWVDAQELEIAIANGNGIGIVKEFWARVEKVLDIFPSCKRFQEPQWNQNLHSSFI